MRNKYLIVIFQICCSYFADAQVFGLVVDKNNEPLPFVNIYIEETLNGTTTNANGEYELIIPAMGKQVVVFKYLGYKTVKKSIDIPEGNYELNITMTEEGLNLDEVQIVANNNPANTIMRKVIAKRQELREKIANYRVNFYSKGLIKIKNAPERILGQELGDFGGGLDSTRTGILYLSETISEVARSNGNLKEKILASKVSGDDNGFSFNAALDVDFSFYENRIELGSQLVSPLAENAFAYYNYQLKGTFFDEGNRLINQIEVKSKRAEDKTFNGTIYIVEDEWALYAVDLKLTGKQAQIVPVDTFYINQSFNYSKRNNMWLKVLQRFDFEYSILGFKGAGRFTSAYKDYDLNPNFVKGDFTSEILSFEADANKKDSIYWEDIRPVPLTTEESVDYKLKDSIQIIRKTQKYLDSVDTRKNKFKLSSLLFGYTYDNTFKEKYYTINTPVENLLFNTVQGWHGSLAFNYLKLKKEKGSAFQFNAKVNYGLSDKRIRPTANLYYRFNKFSRPILQLRMGNDVKQFNNEEPITPIGNTITSLFFERNFAKFYDLTHINLSYSKEIVNGIRTNFSIGFEDRKPLFNTTDLTYVDINDRRYTSNNPLAPFDFTTAPINDHTIVKFAMDVKFRFGQQYLNYPDEKFNVSSEKYPTLYVGYEKGFASSSVANHFDQFKIRINQSINVATKGTFSYNLRAGAFVNQGDISFVDFQHFNGNESYITRKDYMESFLLLPYYSLSTNQEYIEGHAEHNFKGFILNRIPLLKKLNAHLIISGNFLSTTNNRPYSEFGVALGNLGIKKFRFLRLGYAQSYFNNTVERGINVGLIF